MGFTVRAGIECARTGRLPIKNVQQARPDAVVVEPPPIRPPVPSGLPPPRERERAVAEAVADQVCYPGCDGLPMADHNDQAEAMDIVFTLLREHFEEHRDVFRDAQPAGVLPALSQRGAVGAGSDGGARGGAQAARATQTVGGADAAGLSAGSALGVHGGQGSGVEAGHVRADSTWICRARR